MTTHLIPIEIYRGVPIVLNSQSAQFIAQVDANDPEGVGLSRDTLAAIRTAIEGYQTKQQQTARATASPVELVLFGQLSGPFEEEQIMHVTVLGIHAGRERTARIMHNGKRETLHVASYKEVYAFHPVDPWIATLEALLKEQAATQAALDTIRVKIKDIRGQGMPFIPPPTRNKDESLEKEPQWLERLRQIQVKPAE